MAQDKIRARQVVRTIFLRFCAVVEKALKYILPPFQEKRAYIKQIRQVWLSYSFNRSYSYSFLVNVNFLITTIIIELINGFNILATASPFSLIRPN